MKLDLDFPELTALVGRMGADAVAWRPAPSALDPRERLRAELEVGKEVSLADVRRGPQGLLTYGDEQVILYIKDTRKPRETLLNHPEDASKFHVAECSTIRKMRSQNRFGRYVVTRKTTGSFLCDWIDPDTEERGTVEARLNVCKNCLSEVRWRGYGERGHPKKPIFDSFDLSDFLLEYATFFNGLPSRIAEETGPETYSSDWSMISMQTRRAARFTCEKCRIRTPDRPGLLHVHHRNRIKTDNSPRNLEVLCALCHREESGHERMHVSDGVVMAIRRLRRA